MLAVRFAPPPSVGYASHGEDRTSYTRAGVAYAPYGKDGIDIVLDPGIAVGARTIVMPGRGPGGKPASERDAPRPHP